MGIINSFNFLIIIDLSELDIATQKKTKGIHLYFEGLVVLILLSMGVHCGLLLSREGHEPFSLNVAHSAGEDSGDF